MHFADPKNDLAFKKIFGGDTKFESFGCQSFLRLKVVKVLDVKALRD